jgi:phosphatidylserine/phosphatidylglycerophosphate/cardiolipin synthase-like enzyme
VVIDPSSPDCVVVNGSHNLGYRASYNNDENLLIIQGNKALAAAYTAHVMDVYDHYRWRFMLQQKGGTAWNGLSSTDSWQDNYFKAGLSAERELEFWMQAAGASATAVKSSATSKASAAKKATSAKKAPAKHK